MHFTLCTFSDYNLTFVFCAVNAGINLLILLTQRAAGLWCHRDKIYRQKFN